MRITPLSTDSQYVIAGQSLASELAFLDFKSKTRLAGLRLFDRGLNRLLVIWRRVFVEKHDFLVFLGIDETVLFTGLWVLGREFVDARQVFFFSDAILRA